MGGEDLVPVLDDASAGLYRRVVEVGVFDTRDVMAVDGFDESAVVRAGVRLRELGLLRPVRNAPHLLYPVRPDVAASDLLDERDARFHDGIRRLKDARSRFLDLLPAYIAGARHSRLEYLTGVDEIRAAIETAILACRQEFRAMQPSPVWEVEPESRAATERLLAKRVSYRTLYSHTVRADPCIRAYVREFAEAGAEFRTAAALPDRLIIVDRDVAFVPDRQGADPAPDYSRGVPAIVVRDPGMVSFLCLAYDRFWDGARPFDIRSERETVIVGSVEQTVLALLADGLKDEVIARRLGVSVRTCRRYIADAMAALGVTSRFQAGIEAARRGLIEDGA